MPISKSAKKSLASSLTKRARNLVGKAKLKSTLKKANASNLSEVYSTIDKSVKRHLIHKNKAARLKAKLAKKLKNRETEKLRNRETEKLKNRETEKLRNRETEKLRNRETKN